MNCSISANTFILHKGCDSPPRSKLINEAEEVAFFSLWSCLTYAA